MKMVQKKRTKWRANDPKKQKAILMKLVERDRSFTELYDILGRGTGKGWARQTLTLYLNKLVQMKCIKKVPRVKGGKRKIYSLERDHPYVMELLGRLRIIGTIYLAELDERELLEHWLNSIRFAFVNVVGYYIAVGKGAEEVRSLGDGATLPIEKLLEEYLSDMVEVCQYGGEVLAERIRRGEFDLERVWEERDRLLEKVKDSWSSSTSSLDPQDAL